MSKNEFVIDTIPNDDEDLEDLRALKKVKDEISKKKRALKDKDYLNKHPDLEELVQKHRRKKISKKEPEPEVEKKEEKAQKVELEVKETPAKLSWQEKKAKRKARAPTPTVDGFDYDQLAERIAAKMAREKPKKSKPKPKPEPEPEKKGEAEFNKKLDSLPERVIEPPKTVVAKGGKWF
jgi:hypothetical protein